MLSIFFLPVGLYADLVLRKDLWVWFNFHSISACKIAAGTQNDIWEISISSEFRFVILLETVPTEM